MDKERKSTLLEKLAGVGWDLHGYERDPDKMPKPTKAQLAAKSAYDKAVAERDKTFDSSNPRPDIDTRHGFFARTLMGKPSREEQATLRSEYWKKRFAHYKANPIKTGPLPEDPDDFRHKLRLKTPFDKMTNYKLNANIGANAKGFNFDEWTTDRGYSDTPRTKNLSKKDLGNVLAAYRTHAEEYKKANPKDPFIDPGTKAFISKAELLLKNKKMRLARLEYE